MLIPAFALLGFTTFEPLVSLVIFSFSYTLGPVSLISSIPLVLDVSVVGTALGIYKCASNIGSTMVDPAIGAIQDHFDRYDEVMLVLLAFAGLATIGSLVMLSVDYFHLGKLLNMNFLDRKRAVGGKTFDQIAPKASRLQTIIFLVITIVLLATSWGVYISLVVVSQSP